jgi:hypothetical protein
MHKHTTKYFVYCASYGVGNSFPYIKLKQLEITSKKEYVGYCYIKFYDYKSLRMNGKQKFKDYHTNSPRLAVKTHSHLTRSFLVHFTMIDVATISNPPTLHSSLIEAITQKKCEFLAGNFFQ